MQLRLSQVAEKVGCSPSTIRLWERLGKMPRASRFGQTGERRWDEETINNWLADVAKDDGDHPWNAPPVVADG